MAYDADPFRQAIVAQDWRLLSNEAIISQKNA